MMETRDTEWDPLHTIQSTRLRRASHIEVVGSSTASGLSTITAPEIKKFRINVFAPDGAVAALWSIIMLLVTIYQVLTIPYLMAFEGSETITTAIIDFVCFMFFLVDIAMSFNMSFYLRGALCEDRKAIMKKYLRGWFFFDCISTFPYNWLLQSPFETATESNFKAPTLIRIVKISRLLRSFRILRLIKVGQHFINLQQRLSNELSFLITFCSIITVMGCIAHWAACGFYFISQATESPQNWVTEVSMENARDGEKYIAALYWAVTTLTTTGFGDVVPVNSTERVYGITLMVLSAGVFSFLIGKIGMVISDVEKSVNEHKALVMNIARYLRDAHVPEDLSFRALRYVDYKWETRKNRKFIDKRVLSHLSEPLKNEVIVHIFGTIIGKVHCIGKFEHGFVNQLAKNVEPEVYAVSDIIFSEKFKSTEIYFLEKGKVEMFHESSGRIYTILQVSITQSGQHFGELAFLRDSARCASARCVQYAEVLKISRESFMQLIAVSPYAHYTLHVIEDILGSGNFFELGLYCYLCKEFTHLARECAKEQIEVDKEGIQRRWLAGSGGHSKVVKVGSGEPNFKRKPRKVKRSKNYTLRNVKPRRICRPFLMITRAESSSDGEDAQQMTSIDGSVHLLPPNQSDSKLRGSFSFFRGVKTYPLHRYVRGGFIARGSASDNSPR